MDARRDDLPIGDLPIGLDELTRRVLEFERARPSRGRSKQRAIREGLGITPTRYHQVLVDALGRQEALAFDPMLVRRLRRLRDARRSTRLARRLGHPPTHG
ncbi:MAG: DUF3263 domain-containing protein [Actinomycetota bacterium]